VRLRSTRIITPDGVVAGTVVVDGRRIAAVVADGVGPAVRADDAGAAVVADEAVAGAPQGDDLDVRARWVAPGFIDTHVHGGGGAQCNTSDPDEILAVARFHAGYGTTGLLATTVAAPIAELESVLAAITDAATVTASGGAAVLGAHLEGPFLSRSFPGAMDPGHFLPPTRDVWERLLGVTPGVLAMMTIAPELPGALELTSALATAGAVVSLGHTDASYDQALAAARAGATSVTHLFNAMRPMHHRDPGVVGAALDLPDVSCELICDGLHVAGPALRLAERAKGPGGVRLVTDAIEATGMPDGDYRLGGATVTARDGRAVVPGTDRLAGSTLTMQDAVRNAVLMLGVTVEAAVALASANPARLLGIADRKGALAPGYDADLVVLGDDLDVERTMVAGAWLT
jgi:N-acetylglucosamine-6-phosphate deacetylase